jgi:2-polyprenyl-3-methyl-5-hydroxy-6-metoxy-1,4-benzoquinol methylase
LSEVTLAPIRVIRSGLRALSDPAHREFLFRRYVSKGRSFQTNTMTKPDRYPAQFDYLRDHLGADSAADILSFGCSSGEELISLRDRLPRANIHGIDIDPRMIALAQTAVARRGGDPGIRLTVTHTTAAEPDSAYDAILCMAVLRDCRVNTLDRCDRYIRFEDFAAAIADFARCLRPGGLLLLSHSNFRVADTPSAALFETLVERRAGTDTRMFGPDNRMIPGALPTMVILRRD